MKYLRDMKRGEFFTKGAKPISEPKENQVWVRGDYVRSLGAYECYRWDDVNHITFISGKTLVYDEFVF